MDKSNPTLHVSLSEKPLTLDIRHNPHVFVHANTVLSCLLFSLDFKQLKVRISNMFDGGKGLKQHSSSVKIQSTYQTNESETHGEPFNLKQRA